jgi:hypothetical protein
MKGEIKKMEQDEQKQGLGQPQEQGVSQEQAQPQPEEQERTLMDKLLDSADSSNIELYTEDGQKIELEQVAVLMYVGKPYAILRSVTSRANEVGVYQLFEDDEDRLEFVEDKVLAQNVINKYTQSLAGGTNSTPTA